MIYTHRARLFRDFRHYLKLGLSPSYRLRREYPGIQSYVLIKKMLAGTWDYPGIGRSHGGHSLTGHRLTYQANSNERQKASVIQLPKTNSSKLFYVPSEIAYCLTHCSFVLPIHGQTDIKIWPYLLLVESQRIYFLLLFAPMYLYVFVFLCQEVNLIFIKANLWYMLYFSFCEINSGFF